MASGYRSWSGSARTMALSVDAAVAAADAGDCEAFDEALTALRSVSRIDREQLLVLLGTVNQSLLERAAPDGLDAEEAELILRGCLRSAATWYDDLDGDALLRAFTAGVGVADPDPDPNGADGGTPPPTPDAVLAHGVLLVAHLGVTTGTPLPEVLEHALGELRQAQTMELP